MSYFYAHIINLDDVRSELDILDISLDEKNHLILVFESSMHHAVVEALLSDLSSEHKNTLLHHITNDDHDTIWKFLNESHENAEKRILDVFENLKQELRADVKDAIETELRER